MTPNRNGISIRAGRDAAILLFGVKSALRGNRWLWIVPLSITIVVTIAQLFSPQKLSPVSQVTTAEVMGSLLAGFFGANLLDAEFRLRAGELVFAKPYPALRLLVGRVCLAMAAVIFLVIFNSSLLAATGSLHFALPAVAAVIAPGLFLLSLACSIFVASSNVSLSYTGPALFWMWSSIGEPVGLRFDRMYNPLIQISAWSGYLENPCPTTLETLVGNDIVLLAVSTALLAWTCRRLHQAVLS